MRIEINSKGIVGFLLLGVLVAVALETRSASVYIVSAVIWTLLIGASVAAAVRMIRRIYLTPDGRTSVFARGVSRWLLGESDKEAKSRCWHIDC